MGETAFHYWLNSSLLHLLRTFFAARSDVAVAANMMVYYDRGKPKKWFAPDVFVCFGVENKLRRTYKTWEEGVFPQVVFEIASDGITKMTSAESGSNMRGSAWKSII